MQGATCAVACGSMFVPGQSILSRFERNSCDEPPLSNKALICSQILFVHYFCTRYYYEQFAQVSGEPTMQEPYGYGARKG
jgi:hypothetical protein